VWLWGLPPPGPLTVACQWPTEQIPPSQAELDTGLVLAAAARNQPVARPAPAMSFFDMPAWEPPSGYRIPAWLRPPETMIGGIVPVELLLGRTDTHAILVTDLRAYPTGLEFALTVRPRPDLPRPHRRDPDRPSRPFLHHDLWWSCASPTATPEQLPGAVASHLRDRAARPAVPVLPRRRRERARLALAALAVGAAPTGAARLRVHLAHRPTPSRRRRDRRQPRPGGGQSSRTCVADGLRNQAVMRLANEVS
jgi:hypothetical protein